MSRRWQTRTPFSISILFASIVRFFDYLFIAQAQLECSLRHTEYMKYHCDRPLVPFLGLDPAIRHSAGRLVGRSSEPSRRQPAECACVRLERYRERKTERPGSCTQRYKCTTRCFQIPYSSIRLACSASSLLVIASLIDEYKACLLQTKKSCRWIYIRREFCAKHDKAALWLCTSSTSQMFGTGGAALARFKIKCCTPIVCQERCTIMS